MGKLDLLNWARSQIGTKENPDGSNNVPYNTHYYGRIINDSAYAWCVVFVWDGFRQTGQSAAFYGGAKTASCSAVEYWARINGYKVPVKDLQPGDLVIYNLDGAGSPYDHIGIVEEVTASKLVTIEGNVSNAVRRVDRTADRAKISVAIRPPYIEKPATNTIKAKLEALRAQLDAIIKEV